MIYAEELLWAACSMPKVPEHWEALRDLMRGAGDPAWMLADFLAAVPPDSCEPKKLACGLTGWDGLGVSRPLPGWMFGSPLGPILAGDAEALVRAAFARFRDMLAAGRVPAGFIRMRTGEAGP